MTSRPAQRLARAERHAREARERLGDTLDAIQQILSPANLLNEASQQLRARGQDLADSALSKLLSKPVVTTLAASAIGLLLKRKPGLALLAKFMMPGATSRPSKHSRTKTPRADAKNGAESSITEKEPAS